MIKRMAAWIRMMFSATAPAAPEPESDYHKYAGNP